jgi:hypothetical protein
MNGQVGVTLLGVTLFIVGGGFVGLQWWVPAVLCFAGAVAVFIWARRRLARSYEDVARSQDDSP